MKHVKKFIKKNQFAIFIFALCLASASLANSPITSAVTYQTGVGVSFTFNPKLTLTLSSSNLVISNLAPGTSDNSNEIAITVSTNAAYGYNLSATVGNSTTYNNTDLTHTSGVSSGKFTSIAFESNPANYISSISSNNTWGYSIDSGTKYNGLPLYSDTTNIATLKSTDTTPSTGTDTVNFLIGAKASTTQPTGDYKNVINFIAVTNPVPTLEPVACESGKICYNENSLDPVEGTMGKQTTDDNGNSIAGGSTVTLLASNFSRAGYGFAGWSDVHDYDTNPNAHFYGPQETITTPSNMSAGLPLYAVWVESAGYMQTDATRVCNTLTTAPTNGTANLSSVSALTDQRDNQTYAIAKLADGKCWMIENLRLDNSATLTITDTNKPLNDGTNVTLKHNYADTTTSNTLSPTSSVAYDASTAPDGWCTTNSAACDDQSRINTDNTANRATNPTTNSGSMYSYGNYYNWYSATAGNGTYSFSTNNNSVAGDLCPTGWHLPISGRKANVDVSDFWKLSRATIGADPANFANNYFYYTGTPEGTEASSKMRSYPVNYLYSGYVYGGSLYDRGSYGYFWSSTAFSSNSAYYLYLDSSNVGPGSLSGSKYSGNTVRCVAGS